MQKYQLRLTRVETAGVEPVEFTKTRGERNNYQVRVDLRADGGVKAALELARRA